MIKRLLYIAGETIIILTICVIVTVVCVMIGLVIEGGMA